NARGSTGRFLCLRVTSAAGGRREGSRAARQVRSRRVYLRVFHATHHRRCLSLPRVASATRKTSGSQSASCGERIGSWRKRRSGTLGGAGRNRGTANGTGSGCLIKKSYDHRRTQPVIR